ncbi:unnamed protein product [Notodromas monacha]|uniref:Acetyl-CoA acetyltransferase n=1 Tax=Notodromas monacha TaxID=399045 RepID=A0A7R9BE83_9CRUS|nr:unnamed protein product [Notodromas monacha]CAG0913047.1 unnamed protein product [Notodromas monacha]
MRAVSNTMSSEYVVIVAAARTPIGSFLGCLSHLEAHELGAVAIKEVLRRAAVEMDEVSEVIVGQTLTAGKGMNPGRQAAALAGIPYEVPAYTINMLCGSGLKAIMLGAQSLRAGDANVVVCGGQESMSRAEHTMYARNPSKFGDVTIRDSLISDGLQCPLADTHMGVTAENVAKAWNISRNDQDFFAVHSQQKAAKAQKTEVFDAEIISVEVGSGKSVHMDEFPRPNTTTESLSKLKPAFVTDGTGTVTAGNATGLNDGAAFCVLMQEAEARKRGLQPLARIVSYSQVGVNPQIMGIAPVPAVLAALSKADWTTDSVDLFEFNEAFAAQSLAVIRDLSLKEEKVNICGGAIALGHPLGASGARILTTLVYAMRSRGARRGVAALCVGGGMGVAMCVERPPEFDG